MPQIVNDMNADEQPAFKRSMAIWLVLFNYAQAGIGFLVSLWLAKELGPTNYGLLSYGIVLGGICMIVVGFSSERTLVRDLVHSSNRVATMTASILLRAGMAVLVVGSCIGWALADDSLGGKFWPVILCSAWGTLLALSPKAWLDCQYKMHINAGIGFVEKVIYALAIVALVSSGFEGSGATKAAACLLATRVLSVASEWYYVSKSYRPDFSEIKKNIGFLVQQNYLILGAAVANLLMTHANQLLLDHDKGSEGLAYYSVAFQIAMLIKLFQSQVLRLLAPRVAELTRPGESVDRMRSQLMRFTLYSLIATIAVVLPVVLVAPWLIELVDQRYMEAVTPLRILCVWLLFLGPGFIINQFLLGLRLHKTFFLIALAAGILAIVLGLVLVPKYGGNGVAMSLLIPHGISILTQFAIVWFAIRRLDSGSIEDEGNDRPECPTGLASELGETS